MEKLISVILKFRYLFVIAMAFLMLNAIVFLIVGVVQCIEGYIRFVESGFTVSATERPGIYLLEGLDFFMIAMVFLIFGLGMGRLLIFDQIESERLPGWLKFGSITELKIVLWETILLTLVIFCITHLVKSDIRSIDILIFPGVILILSLSLFVLKSRKK